MASKTYAGNHPVDGSGFEIIGVTNVARINWFIYLKRQEHSIEWVNIKVCAENRADMKANYWFALNTETGDIGFGRDYASMQAKRNDLFVEVMRIINEAGL